MSGEEKIVDAVEELTQDSEEALADLTQHSVGFECEKEKESPVFMNEDHEKRYHICLLFVCFCTIYSVFHLALYFDSPRFGRRW